MQRVPRADPDARRRARDASTAESASSAREGACEMMEERDLETDGLIAAKGGQARFVTREVGLVCVIETALRRRARVTATQRRSRVAGPPEAGTSS